MKVRKQKKNDATENPIYKGIRNLEGPYRKD